MINESLKDIYFNYFAGAVHHIYIKKEAKKGIQAEIFKKDEYNKSVFVCYCPVVIHT